METFEASHKKANHSMNIDSGYLLINRLFKFQDKNEKYRY